ncbi:MAG: excinuclease ABC subunit UvrC [Pseudomonadota bacterium]
MITAAGFDAEPFLKQLTPKPGVYQMISADGEVLYVGKARNLKNRVSSYFRASGLASKTMALVRRIHSVQITVTKSETEALLLEQSLIKEERPHYNVVLRDDKSYPFIYLTPHEDYPRLAFHRGAKKKTGRYFGPFPSAGAVRESLNILQKLFQIRQCDDTFFKNRSRPCLQYQIRRCSGPCVGLIEPDDYRDDVRLAEMFLEGHSADILDEYKAKMDAAAQDMEYERAARYRDQISKLRKVQEQQYVHNEKGDVDVFALAADGGVSCVQALFVRGGRLLGQRTWFPRDELAAEPADVLSAFLGQFYLTGDRGDLPRTLVTQPEVPDADTLAAALTLTSGRNVDVVHRVRAQRARWLEMAQENASLSLNTYLADKKNVYARFIDLQAALGLEDVPERLECFDISHTMGEATVASCVVFDREGPAKSDYRRFNIDSGITGGDDFAAMEQALRRRYTRLQSGEGHLPDVLVIDGGKGQLSRARLVMDELQVEGVLLLGIAKGPTRKPGLETFFIDGRGEVDVPEQGGAMHLLQHIRDEAHRFAITGHRARRQKARRASVLDEIEGIGPKRKKELLNHFGSVKGLRGASREEIGKVPGISGKLAADIYAVLHP